MKNKTWLSIAFILFAIVIVLGGTWLMAQNGTTVILPGMMNYGNMPMNGWGMVLVQIFMLVVFALSIAAVVLGALWVARNVLGIVETPTAHELPEDILRTRFAKGEITQEQFNEMRQALVTR